MRARTKSVVKAMGAGAVLGAIALTARYMPVRSHDAMDPPSQAAPAPTSPAASSSAAVELALSQAASSSSSAAPPVPSASLSPPPRAARFDDDPVARAACPADMTLVDGEFCPALEYECVRPTGAVGCAEYARGKRCTEATDHRRYCVDRHEWPNEVGENPRVYVDWFEAKELCASAGKRLCRRSEWILACEGPKRLPYPWGFVRQPSPCNVDRAAIAFDVGAMIDERTREDELARLWQADRIGTHPDCVSAFGAYDLTGNVDEWTDDEADDPGTRNKSTLNGGYWGPVRDTCRLTTKSHGPTFKFYQVGFRCCADTIDGVPVPPPRPFIERDEKKGRPPR